MNFNHVKPKENTLDLNFRSSEHAMTHLTMIMPTENFSRVEVNSTISPYKKSRSGRNIQAKESFRTTIRMKAPNHNNHENSVKLQK